jgi:prepilin-type N-terminal cleavage/methylation domain-containing protein/prepilin-type processing-associated H-X9-DG protein
MKQRGFTLLELLLAIFIISVLMMLSLAGAQRMRIASDRAECVSNLRGLGAAVIAYAADNNNFLPPGNRSNMGGGFHRILAQYTAPMKTTTMSSDVFYCPANVRLGGPPENGFPVGTGYKGWSGYFFNYMLNASVFRITNPDITASTYVPDSEARIRLSSVQVPSRTVALMDLPTTTKQNAGPPTSQLINATYFIPTNSAFSLGVVHGNVGNVLFVDGHVEAFDRKSRMKVMSLPSQSEPW